MAGGRALPDFEREKGSARGYINTKTGERLSRRQYDKLVEAAKAKKTLSPQRKALQDKRQRLTNAVLEAYTRQQRSQGRKLTKKEARKEAGFKNAMAAFRKPKLAKEQEEDDEALIDALQERRDRIREAIEALGGRKEFELLYENALNNSLRR